jgi:hypothetical protein
MSQAVRVKSYVGVYRVEARWHVGYSRFRTSYQATGSQRSEKRAPTTRGLDTYIHVFIALMLERPTPTTERQKFLRIIMNLLGATSWLFFSIQTESSRRLLSTAVNSNHT